MAENSNKYEGTVTKEKRVTVYTNDGQEFTYDDVIVAFNPSYSNWLSISYADREILPELMILFNYNNIIKMDLISYRPEEANNNEQ